MTSETYEWIDTHTHLEHEYPFSVDEYLSNARKTGVSKFVTIGTRPESLETLANYADRYPDVYFTVGIHPHEAKFLDEKTIQKMESLQAHRKCVGVGEIGLDYHYNHSDPEIQKSAFEKQCDLAVRWSKPIIIHAREAEADLTSQLESYVSKTPLKNRPGIIHCFSGTPAFAKRCLELGFYISFSGIVTFKKADKLRGVVAETPIDRILLETDSPFLAPIPHRGKPNQSAYLIETAKIVANTKLIDLRTLSKATVANSKAVFAF